MVGSRLWGSGSFFALQFLGSGCFGGFFVCETRSRCAFFASFTGWLDFPGVRCMRAAAARTLAGPTTPLSRSAALVRMPATLAGVLGALSVFSDFTAGVVVGPLRLFEFPFVGFFAFLGFCFVGRRFGGARTVVGFSAGFRAFTCFRVRTGAATGSAAGDRDRAGDGEQERERNLR